MDETGKILISIILIIFTLCGSCYLNTEQKIECIKIVKDKTSAEIQTICK